MSSNKSDSSGNSDESSLGTTLSTTKRWPLNYYAYICMFKNASDNVPVGLSTTATSLEDFSLRLTLYSLHNQQYVS